MRKILLRERFSRENKIRLWYLQGYHFRRVTLPNKFSRNAIFIERVLFSHLIYILF